MISPIVPLAAWQNPLTGKRHAYAGCRVLTERTRRGFDIAIACRDGGLFFRLNVRRYSAAWTPGQKTKRVDSALSV